MSPPDSPVDTRGRDDFWAIYRAHFGAVAERTRAAALSHPEMGPAVRAIEASQSGERKDPSFDLLERALTTGDWGPYEAFLDLVGAHFASRGVSLHAWFELTTAFEEHLIPLLVGELAGEPDRLARALIAMNGYSDRALRVLSRSYIDAKEARLVEQNRLATERAEQLRASEARYRLLFERSPLPMWLFDSATLTFLAVNDAAVRHYGYSREEFLRMTLRDIRPTEDLASLDRSLEQRRVWTEASVFRHRKKDGTFIDVEISAHAMDYEGRPARLVLANDVTERRRLERQLRQSQKMEAIGQLAGGIAHDFNNILTAMISFAKFAKESLTAADPAREDLEEVIAGGLRAAALTRQLLAFSRVQSGEAELFDVNEVVERMAKMVERLIGEDIDLALALQNELGDVRSDRAHVEQVLLNLIVNARDAMPSGGKLTVETARVRLEPNQLRGLLAAPAGDYVMLAVSDTGCGMDEATLGRIFEPFFTTKPQGHGTGLGLSTVFGIVKQWSGDIAVYSAQGQGTTFKVYLPSVSGERNPQAARPQREVKGHETILLVEDERAVRAVAKRALEAAGYRVIEAESAVRAIELAPVSSAAIDLLLTDVVMPGMNGRELADALLGSRPGMRVLFMSGYTGGALAHQRVVESGAAHLQKPFTPETLLAAVRHALDA